jgi:2-dehydropantoate 2-reductase
VTPRAEALRDALSNVMPAQVTTNIWGYLWGKLVYGAMAFACSCVDAPVPAIMDDALGRRVCRAAAQEAYLVASSQAAQLENIGGFNPNAFAPGETEAADAALDAVADPMRGAEKQHMGIWRDLRVKRRQTEVDMQTAVIVATGRERGIATPVNDAVLDTIKAIEAGELGMEWGNFETIARRGGLTIAAV